MAEFRWAIVQGDTVTNVVIADAAFAEAQGWSTTEHPTGSFATGAFRSTTVGIGYTTSNTGASWTAPKPTASAAARAAALTALKAMLPTLAPALEQAQADAEAYPSAPAETQAQIVVRLIEGTAKVTTALGYLLVHQGYVPTTTP